MIVFIKVMEILEKIQNSLRKEIENVFKEICENNFINIEEYNKLNYISHISYIQEKQRIIKGAYQYRTLPIRWKYFIRFIKVYDPCEYKRLRNLRITTYRSLSDFTLFHVWIKWINILFGASY